MALFETAKKKRNAFRALLMVILLVLVVGLRTRAIPAIHNTEENNKMLKRSREDVQEPPTPSASIDSSTTTSSLHLENLTDIFGKDEAASWKELSEDVLCQDIHIGTGEPIAPGVAVYLNIKVMLKDGTEIKNTYTKPDMFVFTYKKGAVIPGLLEGLQGMKEGGKRRIIVHPKLAYGEEGYTSPEATIPPNAPLLFETSLLFIRKPEWEKLKKFR